VSRMAWAAGQAETLRRYKQFKVQWLLRKQRKIVESKVTSKARPAEAGLTDLGITAEDAPEFQQKSGRRSVAP
jgi:hypothetical protein